MALTIFIKLCTMLDIDKRKKVTKPDYPKKFWIIQKVQKCGQNDSFFDFFSKTALTIFLKLCTMLDNDKRKKVTKPDYPKKILDHPKSPKKWSK